MFPSFFLSDDKMSATVRTAQFGELKSSVVDWSSGKAPRLLVVFSHGFGAPGTDLVPLAGELQHVSAQIAEHVRFVFPQAPIDLGPLGMPGGRAWWPINMDQLATMHQTRDYRELTELEPDGLRAASSQLSGAVQAMLDDAGLTNAQLFLGGFSQGAMVSTDVVLRTSLRPAYMVLMSGTLICRAEWTRLAEEHPGCPVIQTHGTEDMVLPIEPSRWLADMLSDNGFELNYATFRGPHTVPPAALQMTAQAIISQLSEADV